MVRSPDMPAAECRNWRASRHAFVHDRS